jgi:predicted histidine transporter YuiF (NhaC family)
MKIRIIAIIAVIMIAVSGFASAEEKFGVKQEFNSTFAFCRKKDAILVCYLLAPCKTPFFIS